MVTKKGGSYAHGFVSRFHGYTKKYNKPALAGLENIAERRLCK